MAWPPGSLLYSHAQNDGDVFFMLAQTGLLLSAIYMLFVQVKSS